MIFPFDAPLSALQRFFDKIAVDPLHGFEGTACVLWTAGTMCGHGKNARYPAFWYEGKVWAAHRWAAHFIQGQEIDGLQVDHGCCRTLCVSHVKAMPPTVNRELQWIRIQVGIDDYDEYPQAFLDPNAVPFHLAPAWYERLKSALPTKPAEDCPF